MKPFLTLALLAIKVVVLLAVLKGDYQLAVMLLLVEVIVFGTSFVPDVRQRTRPVDLAAGASVIHKGQVRDIIRPRVVHDAAGEETPDEYWAGVHDMTRPHRKRGKVKE